MGTTCPSAKGQQKLIEKTKFLNNFASNDALKFNSNKYAFRNLVAHDGEYVLTNSKNKIHSFSVSHAAIGKVRGESMQSHCNR